MHDDDDDDDEKVGYRRPPKHSRFKPGQSGNPRGRQKRDTTIVEALSDELRATITVQENGRQLRITKAKTVAKSLVMKAVKGDTKAFALIMQLVPAQFRQGAESERETEITDAEKAVLESYLARKLDERVSAAARANASSDLDPEAEEKKKRG